MYMLELQLSNLEIGLYLNLNFQKSFYIFGMVFILILNQVIFFIEFSPTYFNITCGLAKCLTNNKLKSFRNIYFELYIRICLVCQDCSVKKGREVKTLPTLFLNANGSHKVSHVFNNSFKDAM